MSILKAGIKSIAKKRIKRDPKAVAKKIQREKAVDLGTPTGVDETKVLKGQSQATDQANMVRVGRAKAGKQSKGVTKEYKATEKRLEKLQADLKQAKAFLKSAANDQQKKTFSSKVSKITEQVQMQKNKLADMKKKNLIRRKEGGSMKKKMMGGGYMKKKMAGGGPLKPVDKAKNPGLAKLPTPVRNRMGFAKKGKQVSESMGEDRTSVPAEYSAKAQSKKKKKMGGGKVYKRKHSGKVIKNNMSGQDLVNACYD
jgi:hypothetical protein